MTTIKRFNPDYIMHAARFEPFARETEHGEFVRFEDHQQVVSAVEADLDALADRVNALAVERDAARNALASIYKTVTGELPERSNWHVYLDDIVEEVGAAISANQNADALAVENAALKDAIPRLKNIDYSNDNMDDVSLAEDFGFNAAVTQINNMVVETPATDAALAAIQAQGVEKFADMCREKSKLATTADSCAGWKNCSVHASSFAIRLREAK